MSQSANLFTAQQAYRQLGLVSLLIGLVLGALQVMDKLGAYPGFAWICYAFFAFLAFFTVYLIAMSNQSSSSGQAVYLVMGALGLKFIFSVLMVITYMFAVKPTDVRFILPFFFLYAIYTAVETRVLMQLVNTKK
ncbi:MAG TPA: hypothetical protein PK239_05165 [Chitinophagales bacterium]|nr:hypothetical protein [Chitinophagales bacterium]